jgi:peptidoglycan-associated lipoprotein
MRLAPFFALSTALMLAGCLTPRSKPQLSQAVVAIREQHAHPVAAGCPHAALSEVSPVEVGFAFNEATLADVDLPSIELTPRPLPQAAAWLACNPATPVVIKPDADAHGTDAEQDALAARRAEAVRAYLVHKGVAAQRITVLRRGAAEPDGAHVLVLAEGRRW